MSEYRVNLDIYNGPLDLLLYLIRRDELDICDIPIARITEQYIEYVELLQKLDPNLAGDFLVMAASLIEIKTRMLLPTPPPEEGGEDGLGIDPRAELVRQLLEYKAFKDAADDLRRAADVHGLRFPRRPARGVEEAEAAIDLEDAQVWDLLEAFSKLLEAIGHEPPTHQVIYDDTPIELHAADIVDRLGRDGPMTFRRIFEGRTERGELIGLFLALLELVRLRRVLASQDRNFGDIHVHLNPNPPDEDEGEPRPAGSAQAAGTAAPGGAPAAPDASRQAGHEPGPSAEQPAGPSGGQATDRPTGPGAGGGAPGQQWPAGPPVDTRPAGADEEAGLYIPHRPAAEEADEDDAGTEAAGAGP